MNCGDVADAVGVVLTSGCAGGPLYRRGAIVSPSNNGEWVTEGGITVSGAVLRKTRKRRRLGRQPGVANAYQQSLRDPVGFGSNISINVSVVVPSTSSVSEQSNLISRQFYPEWAIPARTEK